MQDAESKLNKSMRNHKRLSDIATGITWWHPSLQIFRKCSHLPSGKLTWQWFSTTILMVLSMIFMRIFPASHVSFREGALPKTNSSHLKIGHSSTRKRSYSNHPFSGAKMLVFLLRVSSSTLAYYCATDCRPGGRNPRSGILRCSSRALAVDGRLLSGTRRLPGCLCSSRNLRENWY